MRVGVGTLAVPALKVRGCCNRSSIIGLTLNLHGCHAGHDLPFMADEVRPAMTSFKAQLLMKDSQILSVFQELAPEQLVPGAPRVLVFDACQVGVVLRTVLFVEV